MRAELPLGTRDPLEVDGYRVVRRLAQGGQGVVYLARTPDDDLVALKLLHPGWLEEPSARERLVKEIGAARTVARFCVAQVLDAKVDGDTPYIVSEFVEGPSLSQHVKERGPLRGAALDRLAVATATALAAIHRARIVHRDLKPSNVMLGPDGPRVIDFGIARDLSLETTSTGRIVGSPNYMSPEQLSGLVVGPPADVFSWGCTVVFAATGRSPFAGDTLVALMYQVVHADPDTDGVPEPLRGLVERCLAKDPDARPTAEQVLLALLGGPGLPAAAPLEAPAEPAGAADAAAPVASLAAGA
uniref:serine/threonine-protein kinase n=1 Tax=Kineosporia sp. A_224 TaxID=1962180 RepID=UPI00117A8B25